jgi:hypothetical protein
VLAASLDGETIIIDAGSTTLTLARAQPRSLQDVAIVTSRCRPVFRFSIGQKFRANGTSQPPCAAAEPARGIKAAWPVSPTIRPLSAATRPLMIVLATRPRTARPS